MARMPPHVRVSNATKASINCNEMDAQLEAVLRNTPIRIESTNRTSNTFLCESFVTFYISTLIMKPINPFKKRAQKWPS